MFVKAVAWKRKEGSFDVVEVSFFYSSRRLQSFSIAERPAPVEGFRLDVRF